MKPNTTVYKGIRLKPSEHTVSPVQVTVDDVELSLAPSLKKQAHSLDGFSWGYNGSGPAQLALAIFLDYFGEFAPELNYYMDFKDCVVSQLAYSWTITGRGIELFLEKQMLRQRAG